MGYDAAIVLFDAMQRAANLDSKEIRDALAATREFKAVTGTISIDANRNAQKAAAIIKIENNRHHYVTTIAP